jgi:hypothetical protein
MSENPDQNQNLFCHVKNAYCIRNNFGAFYCSEKNCSFSGRWCRVLSELNKKQKMTLPNSVVQPPTQQAPSPQA